MTRAPVSVVVLGSANLDHVYSVDRIPLPGQTVLASRYRVALGGKGQNQAVAAARAGADTAFLACLGDDEGAERILSTLRECSIEIVGVRRIPGPTGTAIITVETSGENSIVVLPGANAAMVRLTEQDAAAITASAVLVMQLETPLPIVIEAATLARAAGTIVILNASPVIELAPEVLAEIDVLMVNEGEAQLLAGDGPTGLDAVAVRLLRVVPTLVMTLGGRGARLYRRDSMPLHVPAPVARVVDTTGAGDTFCGAFAAAIAEGTGWKMAMRFAVAAASITVERHGAVPAIPSRSEIDARLARVEVPRPLDPHTP